MAKEDKQVKEANNVEVIVEITTAISLNESEASSSKEHTGLKDKGPVSFEFFENDDIDNIELEESNPLATPLKLSASNDGMSAQLSSIETKALLNRSTSYHVHEDDIHEHTESVTFKAESDDPKYSGELLLGPQTQADGILELKILKRGYRLPTHIKIIDTVLKLDPKTGEVKFFELKNPKIVKILSGDEADDELSSESDEKSDDELTKIHNFDESAFPPVPEDESEVENEQEAEEKDDDDEDLDYHSPTDSNDNEIQSNDALSNDKNVRNTTSNADDKIQFCNDGSDSNEDLNYHSDISDTELKNEGNNSDDAKKSKKITLKLSEEIKRELECRKLLAGDGECPIQIVIVGKTCYVIDDYIPGKTLTQVLIDKITSNKEYSAAEMLNLMRQAVLATKFVHDHRIVHGDLKTDNLMVAPDESKITLIDFGGSAAPSFRKLIDYTHVYVPPEYYQLAREKKDLPVDKTIDMYALGMILLHCLLYAFDDKGHNERALKRNRGRREGGFVKNTYLTKLHSEILPYLYEIEKNKDISDVASFSDDEKEITALADDMKQLEQRLDTFFPDSNAGKILIDLIDSLLHHDPEQRPANCDVVLEKLNTITAINNFHDAKRKIEMKFKVANFSRLFQPVVEKKAVVASDRQARASFTS
jgi:serine/threonine protein kinase